MTDGEGKFHFDGACEGWLRIHCGYASEDSIGCLYAKGGDTVKVVMNNNYHSLQLHPVADSFEGVKLPMYEELTKGVQVENLENKKLLICFWWINGDGGKKNINQLTKISDDLDSANISVVLINAQPYPVGNKWLKDNKIPFAEAGLSDLGDIMEFRRVTGVRFLPHMILTDENKIITNQGFDIQWLRENAL